MKNSFYVGFLCLSLMGYSGFSQSSYYKQAFEDAMKKTTWTKTTYTPMLTGQWGQNGSTLLTVNLGMVTRGSEPQFEIVEYFKSPESFVIVAKRSESYGGDPAQPCYYAIYVRYLTDNSASFAIIKGVCTGQTGPDEYYHGVGRIVDGIDDAYASNNGVFFSCTKN